MCVYNPPNHGWRWWIILFIQKVFVEDFVKDYDDGRCDGDLDYECLSDEENISTIKESNEYIKSICDSSEVHLLEEARSVRTYEKECILGLFYLFIASSFLKNCIFKWTKDVMKIVCCY